MDDRLALLALNLVDGLGPRRIYALVAYFGSPLTVWEADISDLKGVPGIGSKLAEAIVKARRSGLFEKELELLEKEDIGFLTTLDDEYPSMLREIELPPPVLYLKGEISNDRKLAIVGTRRPTQYGRKIAHSFSKELASRGIGIVSGLARGIDSEAHKGALEGGGKTYAVLGSGLLNVYPPELKELASDIALNGALISEFPLRCPPFSWNFPRRNRVISGLSEGVLVVEAPLKSGAMITASFALDQGRDVYAVPGSIFSPKSKGPNLLIGEGAKPILGFEDLLEEFGVSLDSFDKSAKDSDLSAEERRFLDKLPLGEVLSLDVLFYNESAYGWTVLTLLEIKGYIRRVEGGRIIRLR
ncbi:MAG: DNA-processing protein DprA [Synergistetes bacterium]|nr:DNA-processing protein DprA [Synergistota bacterium]